MQRMFYVMNANASKKDKGLSYVKKPQDRLALQQQ